MKRIAFHLIGGQQWTGGRNYLRNLLAVLTRYERERISPVLFIGRTTGDDDLGPLKDLSNVAVVRHAAFDPPTRRSGLIKAMSFGSDGPAVEAFQAHGIDAVFESAQFFGWRQPIPAIAWIPDFQHRLLPHLFSRREWLKRDLGFKAQVAAGRLIMLSSDDAKRACETYYPASRGRTHTVSFAIEPQPPIELAEAREITRGHGLADPFVFMPNQFWRHKNHELVIEALGLLRQRGRRITVAASGHQADPRCPEHFPALEQRIKDLGLADDFRLLGLIPYPHIAALLRTCAALLNPSLFEGWSTTVEEARLLGTPMLLSDLDVHKEQMGPQATYFDRHSADALADVLERFTPLDAAARDETFERARREGESRARAYAKTFTDLVEHAASSRRD